LKGAKGHVTVTITRLVEHALNILNVRIAEKLPAMNTILTSHFAVNAKVLWSTKRVYKEIPGRVKRTQAASNGWLGAKGASCRFFCIG
jgi:uncharacterized protein YdaU (DUF1376 family)